MAEPATDLEWGLHERRSNMHLLPRRYYGLSRILRISLIAIVVFLVGKEVAIRIQGDFDYKIKILPTDFKPLEIRSPGAMWLPQQPVHHMNGTNIGDRYVFMRHLGTGNEGEASLYVDLVTGEVVVAKTWFGPLKNIRNVLPA